MIFSKSKFPALSALAGIENPSAEAISAANEELKAAGINALVLVALSSMATAEALTAAQEDLQATATKLTETEAALQSASTSLTEAQASIDSLTAERDSFKKAAEAYGMKPGASATAPVLEGEEDITSGSEEDYQAVIDALPHNVALKNNPLFYS